MKASPTDSGMIVKDDNGESASSIVSCLVADDHKMALMEAELAALRNELDHERSVRRLEDRRTVNLEKRYKRQMEYLAAEEMESRELMEEMKRSNEANLEQALNARREADERWFQAEQKMTALLSTKAEENAAMTAIVLERNKRCALETKCQALEGELKKVKDALTEASRQNEQNINNIIKAETVGKTEIVKKRKLSEQSFESNDVSDNVCGTAVVQQLNELKVQLAQTQRSNRQWMRKAADSSKRANEALHFKEAAQHAQEKLDSIQKERDFLLQQKEKYLHTESQWLQLAAALRPHTESSKDGDQSYPANNQCTYDGAPPEIATVLRNIRTLKQKSQDLQHSLDISKVQLQAKHTNILNLEQKIQKYEKSNQTLQVQNESLVQNLKQTQQKLTTLQAQDLIWKKETDSMRTLLSTYEDMEQNLISKSSTNKSNTNENTQIESNNLSASAASLNVSLQSAKKELKLMSENNQQLTEQNKQLQNQSNLDKQEHQRVLTKFEKLKQALYQEREKAEKAEERALDAETLAGKGSFNPETTKVLHLQTNPLMNAIREKHAAEVAKLQALVQELQNQKKQSSSDLNNSLKTPPNSSSSVTANSSIDAQKLHQRLKKQFREQISSYREGVYLLTGYKIEMQMETSTPRFKVRSVFSEHEDDHLLFQWPAERDREQNDVQSLDILSTDMAKILSHEPSFEYMTKFNSLPAFLASVTLSLFEKQTFVS